jgi:UTP--glucose-1-phosphate uridylyltransferase
LINQLEDHFPAGAPSLMHCDQLIVKGEIKFGEKITCRGQVRLINESGQRVEIPDGETLEGERLF